MKDKGPNSLKESLPVQARAIRAPGFLNEISIKLSKK
jgi:hypothetical protein